MIFTDNQILKLQKVLLAKRKITKNDCWEWQGARGRRGYGNITFYGKTYKVHRIAFKIFREDPGALAVCHHCDNPPCFNPTHLFKATLKENQQDCMAKGRARPGWTPGELSGHAVLTDKAVVEMRQLYCPYIYTAEMLAHRYGVSLGCVIKAIRGETWKHIKARCGK